MGWKEFFKPDGGKILLFLLLLVIAPFPYFVQSGAEPSKLEVRFVWGFPPLVSLVYEYLPPSLQRVNAGILEVSRVKATYLWMPAYASFIFLLSCCSNLLLSKIKEKYGIETFRGILWKRLHEERKLGLKEKPKKVEFKHELKEFPSGKRLSEEQIEEMAEMIEKEESFIEEQKKKLEEYVDEINKEKLKRMGLDTEENKILCSKCKRWIPLSKKKILRLLEEHGFEVIWKYVCHDCSRKR